MASRFASLQPETLAAIQTQLEQGQLRDWADLCDRMLQRDADILATYESRLSVVSGAELLVEPGVPTGDPVRDMWSDEAAAWVDSWLRKMPVSRYAHESLDGIGKGLSVHEIIWDHTDSGLVPVELEWIHLRRFCYGPDWRPRICDKGGDVPYSPTGYELERDRFVVHEPRALPGYPTGGVMRPVMWLFLFKSWAMQFGVQGAEQFAYPLKVATISRGGDESVRAAAREWLENLSQDHAAVIDEGTRIELLESTVKDGNVWSNLIKACNEGIAKALLGMSDLADPTRVGAYAAVETRKGATVDARVLKDERALALTWERDLVEPALRANVDRFGGMIPPVPRLRWSIAARRQEIPADIAIALTVDEVRASLGKEPIGGPEGKQLWRDFRDGKPAVADQEQIGGEALNGAQIQAVSSILAQVYARLLSPRAARALIIAAVPTIASELVDEMLADAPSGPPIVPPMGQSQDASPAPLGAPIRPFSDGGGMDG